MNDSVYLTHIELKHFRCFESVCLDLSEQLVLIEGKNGSGKTSILEALHYLCYLKSFRTVSIRDMIQFGFDGFFIRIVYKGHEISVGNSGAKRQILIDKKQVESYQELREYYQIVTLTEHDLNVVQDSPEARRSFIDHTLILFYPELITPFKEYKIILESRNKVLLSERYDSCELELWTEKLFFKAQEIYKQRLQVLKTLSAIISTELLPYFERQYDIVLSYNHKKCDYPESLDNFMKQWQEHIFPEEKRFKRSCFGIHLDDISIIFNGKPARMFSSRGQQKLIVMLLKMAQVIFLQKQGKSTTFLLDDFLTDFDPVVTEELLRLCQKLSSQLIFTSPLIKDDIFVKIFEKKVKIVSM